MAQTGFTPIQLYRTTTAAATPTAGNLADGELAINTTDERLFFKNAAGTVKVIAGAGGAGVVAGSNTQVQFNNNGVFGASANMTFNGTRLTVADLADSGLTAGRVTYASSGGALVDSANLTFDGTNLGLAGGTANGVAYLNGSKVLTTGSALTFDGTNFGVNGSVKIPQAYALEGRNAANSGTAAWFGVAGRVDFGIGGDFAIIGGTSGVIFGNSATNSEQMRLTSTGLGIGTSSPTDKLNVGAFSGNNVVTIGAGTTGTSSVYFGDGTGADRYRGYIDYEHTNDRFVLGTSGTGKATLDSSGNLGLGVTPSAWGGSNKAIDIGTIGNVSADSATLRLTANSYTNSGGTSIYKTTGPSFVYLQNQSLGHAWFTAPSGTAGNAITFTQAMTLDASGNLLLATTSPGSGSSTGLTIGSGRYIWNVGAYNFTTASGANLVVQSDGIFQRSSSAAKYKQDVRDLEAVDISNFRPVRYKSKCQGDDQTKEHFGIVADEVAQAGIEELVTRGSNGEVEGFQYDRFTVVLLKSIQEQQTIITALTARVAALESN